MKELEDEEMQNVDGGAGTKDYRYCKKDTKFYDLDNEPPTEIGILKKGTKVEIYNYSSHAAKTKKLDSISYTSGKIKGVPRTDIIVREGEFKGKKGCVQYTAISNQKTRPQ